MSVPGVTTSGANGEPPGGSHGAPASASSEPTAPPPHRGHARDFASSSGWASLLRCPVTGARLEVDGDRLAGIDGVRSYRIDPSGIPIFVDEGLSSAASVQREHFDRVADAYLENLTYPHTREYVRYLDERLAEIVGTGSLGRMAEICCGHGEALSLFGERCEVGVGVDVSLRVLHVARATFEEARIGFVQADATRMPIASASIDTVVMLGGIHHVADRAGLFAEVARILVPGGRFVFREPVDDFWPWRWIRALVYRLSPALDSDTEEPLRRHATERDLAAAGLELASWRTFGFVGFCLFMNSDVLVFNRLFRHVPGIRAITRAATRLDDRLGRLRPLRGAGLQVVGVGTKPPAAAESG